jgi:hypothetical protein
MRRDRGKDEKKKIKDYEDFCREKSITKKEKKLSSSGDTTD